MAFQPSKVNFEFSRAHFVFKTFSGASKIDVEKKVKISEEICHLFLDQNLQKGSKIVSELWKELFLNCETMKPPNHGKK